MWRIYYGDGSIYEGAPELAPKRGIVSILQPNEDESGYHVVSQKDFYLWRDVWGGVWQAADWIGFMFYLLDPGWKIVLFGETIPNPEYERINGIALAERRRLNSE